MKMDLGDSNMYYITVCSMCLCVFVCVCVCVCECVCAHMCVSVCVREGLPFVMVMVVTHAAAHVCTCADCH